MSVLILIFLAIFLAILISYFLVIIEKVVLTSIKKRFLNHNLKSKLFFNKFVLSLLFIFTLYGINYAINYIFPSSFIITISNLPPDPNVNTSAELESSSGIELEGSFKCIVIQPYGSYLFEQPSESSLVLAVLPQNSLVEVEVDNHSSHSIFTKVYVPDIGFGWVNSKFLFCEN